MNTAPLIKLRSQSLYQYHTPKLLHCMQNFVQFHAIESEIGLSKEFWDKRNSSAPY